MGSDKGGDGIHGIVELVGEEDRDDPGAKENGEVGKLRDTGEEERVVGAEEGPHDMAPDPAAAAPAVASEIGRGRRTEMGERQRGLFW